MRRLTPRLWKRAVSGQKLVSVDPIGSAESAFLIRKPAIIRKVKEIEHLCGGVAPYAAQAHAQIDAEIVEKGGFRAETS